MFFFKQGYPYLFIFIWSEKGVEMSKKKKSNSRKGIEWKASDAVTSPVLPAATMVAWLLILEIVYSVFLFSSIVLPPLKKYVQENT